MRILIYAFLALASNLALAGTVQNGMALVLERPIPVIQGLFQGTSDPEFCVARTLSFTDNPFTLCEGASVTLEIESEIGFILTREETGEQASVVCYEPGEHGTPQYISLDQMTLERLHRLLGLKLEYK